MAVLLLFFVLDKRIRIFKIMYKLKCLRMFSISADNFCIILVRLSCKTAFVLCKIIIFVLTINAIYVWNGYMNFSTGS